MKKLIGLIILLGTMVVYAFTQSFSKADHSEITFPVTEELKGRTIPIDSAMFRYPYRLEVRGDRVVIEDLHGPITIICSVILTSVIFPRLESGVKLPMKCRRWTISFGTGRPFGRWTTSSLNWYDGN